MPRSIQDPLTSTNANVIATLNVLLASRDAGVRRVVYSSSSSVYGANEALPKQEDLQPLPITPYPLDGVERAYSYYEERHAAGDLLVVPA